MDVQTVSTKKSLKHSLHGGLFISSVCVFFDYLWNEQIPHEYAIIAGILHGALLFGGLGAFLGSIKRSGKLILKGFMGGILCGVIAAGAFYVPYFPLLKLILPWKYAYFGAMVLSWITIWKLLANLTGLLNGEAPRFWHNGWRGFFASLISVPGFALITELWKNPGSYNYALAFGAWFIAFFPALLVILVKRPQTSHPDKWVAKTSD